MNSCEFGGTYRSNHHFVMTPTFKGSEPEMQPFGMLPWNNSLSDTCLNGIGPIEESFSDFSDFDNPPVAVPDQLFAWEPSPGQLLSQQSDYDSLELIHMPQVQDAEIPVLSIKAANGDISGFEGLLTDLDAISNEAIIDRSASGLTLNIGSFEDEYTEEDACDTSFTSIKSEEFNMLSYVLSEEKPLDIKMDIVEEPFYIKTETIEDTSVDVKCENSGMTSGALNHLNVRATAGCKLGGKKIDMVARKYIIESEDEKSHSETNSSDTDIDIETVPESNNVIKYKQRKKDNEKTYKSVRRKESKSQTHKSIKNKNLNKTIENGRSGQVSKCSGKDTKSSSTIVQPKKLSSSSPQPRVSKTDKSTSNSSRLLKTVQNNCEAQKAARKSSQPKLEKTVQTSGPSSKSTPKPLKPVSNGIAIPKALLPTPVMHSFEKDLLSNESNELHSRMKEVNKRKTIVIDPMPLTKRKKSSSNQKDVASVKPALAASKYPPCKSNPILVPSNKASVFSSNKPPVAENKTTSEPLRKNSLVGLDHSYCSPKSTPNRAPIMNIKEEPASDLPDPINSHVLLPVKREVEPKQEILKIKEELLSPKENFPPCTNIKQESQASKTDMVISGQPVMKSADGILMVSLLKANTVPHETQKPKKKLDVSEYFRRKGTSFKESKTPSSETVQAIKPSPESAEEQKTRKCNEYQEKLNRMHEAVIKAIPPKLRTPKVSLMEQLQPFDPIEKVEDWRKKEKSINKLQRVATPKVPDHLERITMVNCGVNTDLQMPIQYDHISPVMQEIEPILRKASSRINNHSLITEIVDTLPKVIKPDMTVTIQSQKTLTTEVREHKTVCFLHKNRVRPVMCSKSTQTGLSLLTKSRRSSGSLSHTSSSSTSSQRDSASYRHSVSSSESCSPESGRSYSSRSSEYSSRSRNYNNRPLSQAELEHLNAVEERRILYVGRIENGTTKDDLRKKFKRFGPIQSISIHYRDSSYRHLDNYGFVTFRYKRDAHEAYSHGNDNPNFPAYRISFGGRREFCGTTYADLDNVRDTSYRRFAKPQTENSFERLLKQEIDRVANQKT